MDERGLTIVETLIAVVMLAIGVLALAGTGASVIRMLADGRRTAAAAQVAASRIEVLRRIARSTNPPCGALSGGSAPAPGTMLEAWAITSVGPARLVVATVTYRSSRGLRTDTVATAIGCL